MSEKKLLSVPEVGKTYHCFDDWKIRLSRRMNVTITEVIPFDKADDEIVRLWMEEKSDDIGAMFLAKETDCFIRAKVEISDKKLYDVVYARAEYGGWDSLHSWGGILDVDGSLNAELEANP